MSKNPAAVELGRRGGLKGGPARAEMLSDEERSAIAALGGRAKWERERERRIGRPSVAQCVKLMMAAIVKSGGRQHTLFIKGDEARYCETGSDICNLWNRNSPDEWVGNFGPEHTMTEIMTEAMT